jgi:hypothetical protein
MQQHLYLDFECNKQKTLYIAGYALNGRLHQVVFHEGLAPMAAARRLPMISAADFIAELVDLLSAGERELVAYSEHDIKVIMEHCNREGLKFNTTIRYLNLAKAAGTWIAKHKQREFDELPPVLQNADEYQQDQMEYSLASVMRLTNLKPPKDYGHMITMQRLNTVIDALDIRQGDYESLTPIQKGKASKALKHNKYDVDALPVLYAAIAKDDEGCFRQARKEFVI